MPKNALNSWLRRLVLALGTLLVVAALALWLFLRASLAQLDGSRQGAGLQADVSVARDAHGVPTISGSSRDDVAYATGFVHAQERYFQMDLLRRLGAGELAELFGARALPLDRARRLHRFRARAGLALQAMPAAQRALLDRYVAGVNDGLGALAARPFEYALIGTPPRAWSADDSLLVIWAMYFDLQGGLERRELSRGWLQQHSSAEQLTFLLPESSEWEAPLDGGPTPIPAPIPANAPDWWGRAAAEQTAALMQAGPMAEHLADIGSNNWVVAGTRSGDGAAIVSNDMHLGIQLPNTWYRAVLRIPDRAGGTRRVVGVTLPGAPPAIVVGSNGKVAWGFTNSYGDYLDLVEAASDPARPGQVRFGGVWETARTVSETILVKGAPSELMTVRESSLGPLRQIDGRSYAVHWAAHAPGAVNMNTIEMEQVGTLDAALRVASSMGIPAQNIVVGDSAGQIGWTIAGPLPRRARPGVGATFPLRADAPDMGWQGWLAPSAYPNVRNPPDEQLYSANSRQLIGPDAALLGDGGFDLGARARQVRDDLTALGPKTDAASVYQVGLDDRALFMAPWRERIITTLDAAAVKDQPQRLRFLQLLRSSWDGHASIESVGYRLTRAFMYALHDMLFESANGAMAALDPQAGMAAANPRWPVVLATLLDEQPAGWLPPPYTSWQALRLAAVDRVIAELTRSGQSLETASWGQRNRVAIAHPIAASLPLLARWLSAPDEMMPGDSHMPRVSGRTFGQSERLTVAPGREEQGLFAMPGGQSGHPLSPFFLSGHADWVAGRAGPLLPGPTMYTLTLHK